MIFKVTIRINDLKDASLAKRQHKASQLTPNGLILSLVTVWRTYDDTILALDNKIVSSMSDIHMMTTFMRFKQLLRQQQKLWFNLLAGLIGCVDTRNA